MFDNFVDASGEIIFFNYSHEPSGTILDASANTLVIGGDTIVDASGQNLAIGGETLAEADAEAFFLSDFSDVFSESSGFGIDGIFQGIATSDAQIVAEFSVAANETFSFDLVADLFLLANEIENPDAEYNEAQLDMGFLLLDTSDPDKIKLLDYLDMGSALISSEQIGSLEINLGKNKNFIFNYYDQTIDVDGDNQTDIISATIEGTYERTFNQDTNLTLIKVSQTAVQWLGDSLIGNLGPDFTYGTILDDRWSGAPQNDNFYGSLGDDILNGRNGNDFILAGYGSDTVNGGNGEDQVFGSKGNDLLNGNNQNDQLFGGSGDDTLNGGRGEDELFGGEGNDLLNGDVDNDVLQGESGNDILDGGMGNDVLTGGSGIDQFLYKTSGVFTSAKVGVDLITDLMVDIDKIVLSQRTFNRLTPTIDGLIDPSQFEVVDNDELAAVSDAFITYSSATGNLFYNENGSKNGFGRGDQFATLENIPTLSATDIMLTL